jgi:signal transduction histidine kinase
VELDLAQAIRSSVEFARPITEQAGVRLAFCTEGHSVKVMGNGGALQQVVLNLVCNAVRHTGAGGCVRVSVRRVCSERGEGAGRALLEFADTGCGIAAELLDEIFRAGFSGSGTTSGLGLAVCSQIVKQHDGTIRVESKLGRGTSFFVEIPTL